jgi:hypothetical protein
VVLLVTGGYFQNIFNDYRAAFLDMVQDMKDAPRKTTFYLTLVASGVVLAKTNPSKVSFEIALAECHHEILMLGPPIRNRISDNHIQMLQSHFREGTLRITNCVFFSLVWTTANDPAVDRFDAQCGLVKPRWRDFHKTVVDVGVLGRWLELRKYMVDYDINPDEWDAEGQPTKKRSVQSSAS